MANRLSKSRFQTGLQCPKALWLSTRAHELADPIDETTQHIFDTGTSVGELARERFGGGVLVAEDYTKSAQALETTRLLLEGPPAAIFEAALEHGGVFVRPDVLVRVGDDLWDLYEVKSSTKVKAVNITDVAIQTWVLEGAGLKIRRAYLMHLDNTYVYAGGDYDLQRLFTAEDVTDQTRTYMTQCPDRVLEMLAMLDADEPPAVPIGKHCDNPYTCAFYGHCHAFLPSNPVTELPGVREPLLDSLIADGIFAIEEVPLDYPGLNSAQRTVCELVRSGEPKNVGDVRRSLAGLNYPIHFIDFETFMSALPLYPGTRPWQTIPFQWSDHVLRENGDLEHREFLYEGSADPRRSFTESLIDALGESGSIVVYSPYERSRLNELTAAFPEHAEAIAAIQRRLFDLLQTVRAHVRHPDCLGSSSIKVVLPALVPGLSYKGLSIADGSVASLRYLQATTGQLPAEECQAVYADLREYCGLDTLAMVRLLEVLRADGETAR
jgi:predicted RecB family nuclease